MSFSDIGDTIAGWGMEFSAYKAWIEAALPFHDDALHVAVGVVLQLIGAFVLRSSVARWRPWLFAFVLELLNEANDLMFNGWDRPGATGTSAMDIALTMALPTLLLMVARRAPRLLAGR
ncbi:hypothetical protein [Croceicoccus hydrothermalis]|uniref:hypothetical protein n=1 Tax=Croceicoccus hydrothermalis TaxID=2867964 RepID=UPI001EFAB457|nr:hypothetical protein [Croceicoccus hydrothermalis]